MQVRTYKCRYRCHFGVSLVPVFSVTDTTYLRRSDPLNQPIGVSSASKSRSFYMRGESFFISLYARYLEKTDTTGTNSEFTPFDLLLYAVPVFKKLTLNWH